MRLYRDIDSLPAGARLVLTVGVFDGMHRGHLALVRAAVRYARRHGAEPAVVTFDVHPDQVFGGGAPPLLCDPAERLSRLAAAGVAHVVLQRFDRAFAAQAAEEFLDRVRRGRDLAAIVMTPESAIGRGRAGTPGALREVGVRDGFAVEVVPTLELAGARVSASRIREFLAAGRLAGAAQLLGRRPAVIGTVVEGAARGRRLGYRTANLAFEAPVALPPNGIYAVEVSWGGREAEWGGHDPLRPARRAGGVASLGVRPTFQPGERLLEIHLFDVDEDLYGMRLRVAWVRRQRDERRFATPAALVAQMDRDADRARALLARHGTDRDAAVSTPGRLSKSPVGRH